MQFRELWTDDDAVSPVIGVILMVAITVILAAVIGAFVLGFGGGGPSAPSTSWDSETTNSSDATVEFTLTQSGGNISDGTLSVSDGNTSSIDYPLSAGDSFTVSGVSDETVSIVWEDEGSSSTLYEHEV